MSDGLNHIGPELTEPELSEARVLDHHDAFLLAFMRQNTSNLARCYIEIRYVAKMVLENYDMNVKFIDRLREIANANDV